MSGKRPGELSRMVKTFCFDWDVDYMRINMRQNLLSSTLKICAFYCM